MDVWWISTLDFAQKMQKMPEKISRMGEKILRLAKCVNFIKFYFIKYKQLNSKINIQITQNKQPHFKI